MLQNNGITEVWVISLKAKQQLVVLSQKQDTITKITETIVQRPAQEVRPEMSIQVGAFRLKSNAIALLDQLTASLDKKVTILYENGYFKVRIILFPMLEESLTESMKKLKPSLVRLKLNDIWVLPVHTPPEEEPAVVRPEITLTPVELKKEVTVTGQPETTRRLVENKLVAPVIPSEPTISLQVAIFRKKIQALYAKMRITKKLKLPVEIVKEYDYYKVIVTGFYTREETFRFYPELAGMGYNNIYLIENK